MNKNIKKLIEKRKVEIEEFGDFQYYNYQLDDEDMLCLYCSVYNGITGRLLYLSHDIEEDDITEAEVEDFFEFVVSAINLTQLE